MVSVKELENLLTGKSDRHLADFDGCRVHRELVEPLRQLQRCGGESGLDIRIASGFRSFEQQLHIWNAKANGQRPVFDDNGQPIDLALLDEKAQLFAILRWSALPGASRHHWGTDLDVWDVAAVSGSYDLQLTPDEYTAGGPFHPLCRWLQREIDFGNTNFFLPYNNSTAGQAAQGVAIEPWHISYRPLAENFGNLISEEIIGNALIGADLVLKRAILTNLGEIFRRFVSPG